VAIENPDEQRERTHFCRDHRDHHAQQARRPPAQRREQIVEARAVRRPFVAAGRQRRLGKRGVVATDITGQPKVEHDEGQRAGAQPTRGEDAHQHHA
jgi:hypothetical protein